MRLTATGGSESDGAVNSSSDKHSPSMAPPKKLGGDVANGAKNDSQRVGFAKKDADARATGPNSNKADGKAQNGTWHARAVPFRASALLTAACQGGRPGFRTDSAISGGRGGGERQLTAFFAGGMDGTDGGLDSMATSNGSQQWDQFAANEKLFGLTTDYDENIYTTQIDTSHPRYRERLAAANKTAREIERSVATTSHVAEERVMDYAGGEDKNADEEDK